MVGVHLRGVHLNPGAPIGIVGVRSAPALGGLRLAAAGDRRRLAAAGDHLPARRRRLVGWRLVFGGPFGRSSSSESRPSPFLSRASRGATPRQFPRAKVRRPGFCRARSSREAGDGVLVHEVVLARRVVSRRRLVTTPAPALALPSNRAGGAGRSRSLSFHCCPQTGTSPSHSRRACN